MKISVYGAGYVGLVSAACLAKLSHQVFCVDINKEKIEKLQQNKIPIYEPGLQELVTQLQESGQLNFTSDIKSAIDFSSLHMICVGTPAAEDGSSNLSALYAVSEQIAEHIEQPIVLVIKSTVPPGTGLKIENFLKKQLQTRAKQETLIAVTSNPEFLREGQAVHDFLHPDRVIVGSSNENAARLLKQIYAPLCNEKNPCLNMDITSAELSKYAANSMLAARISLINELANIAEQVGADIQQVSHSLGFDPRIGPHFLQAGCGYGGSCFPKDVQALLHTAKQVSVTPHMLTAIEQVNKQQQHSLYEKINQHFNAQLQNKVIAVWGLAFKPGTDDIRAAPSLVLIKNLLEQGASVQAYDPVATANTAHYFSGKQGLHLCEQAFACLEGVDALVILTDWLEFRQVDLMELKKQLPAAVIFDGRNLYQPRDMLEHGFVYYSVGRSYISCHPTALDRTRGGA